MNQTELMIAAGGGLFLAFLLGWLAGWLAMRAGEPAGRAPPAPQSSARPLMLGADDRMAAAERDLALARDDLRAAQGEIEELRAYIGRTLGKRPDGAPLP